MLGQVAWLEEKPTEQSHLSWWLQQEQHEAPNTKTVPAMVSAPPIPAIEDIAVDSDSATQLTH